MLTYKNILEVSEELQEKVRLWRGNPRVKAGMLDPSDISKERHGRWLESLAKKIGTNEVRIAFSDGVPFGVITLRDIKMDVSSCDSGAYIGENAFEGRGLGLRLIYDLLQWGFVEVGVNKMYSTVRSDNLKVLNYDLHAGYYIEGFLKDHMRAEDGERIGIYLIAQFQDEWLKNREKIASWAKIGN